MILNPPIGNQFNPKFLGGDWRRWERSYNEKDSILLILYEESIAAVNTTEIAA